MRLLRVVVVALLLAGGLLASGVPAQAQPVINHSRAIATLNSTGLPGYPHTEPRFGDAGTAAMFGANYAGGFQLAYPAPNDEDRWWIQFAPPAGQSFHRGHYPVVNSNETPGQAYADIYIGSNELSFHGDIDVLDWVPGPNNLPSRFDIVFRDGTSVAAGQGYFGEVRLNEPNEGAVHLGSRHLEWPSTAVGSTPITATEWLHNTSTGAVSIGSPKLSGEDAADWRVTGNTCPATLAAGATCSLVLGYSPTAGGPRIAALQLPVGGKTQTVPLTGEAPLGTSSLTYSGTDWVSGGRTHSFPNWKYVMETKLNPAGAFVWDESTPYADWFDPTVQMSAPGGGPLAIGTHATVGTAQTGGTQYGEDTFGLGAGCLGYAGSMTVHAFTLDATGVPAMADIDYTQRCVEQQDPSKVMTAHLLWQYRSDTTPPTTPTDIAVSGTSVHWTKSTSSDAVESIARLVPGTGQDATPTTGYPLAAGSTTTATLPTLTSGETYTIAVFAVDATGNVSNPQTQTLIG